MSRTKLPDRQPTLRVVTMPADTNSLGGIFGGWIMAQVDIAGSIPAIQRAKGRVATVAVNAFEFQEPVLVGDVVSFYGDVTRVGRTSITVHVDVYAERLRYGEGAELGEYEAIKVTQADLTFVALDATGKPRLVPQGYG